MKPLVFFPAIVWLALALCVTLLCSSCGANSSSSPAANPLLPVREAQVSLGGSQATILTDARGFALYFYTPDTPTNSACTGACAVTWPPLLTHAAHPELSASLLPGKLTVQQAGNGPQVEYNGHLLYTYISDREPGQITGNGVNNWYVATPDLKQPTT